MKKLFTLFQASLCAALLCSSANADISLLLDFHGNDNGGLTAASSADFIVNDANIDPAAIVNTFDADTINPNSPAVTISGVGIGAEIVTLAGSGFNPTGGPFVGDAILGDYLFGSNIDPAFTLTGLEEIVPGSVVTLVGYSHGDQTAQVADLVLSYDDGGVVSTQTSAVTSVASPFQTFTFTTTSTLNSLTLTADNGGEGNQFAAINGFSLTTVAPNVVPEPSALALLGLGTLATVVRRRRR